MRKTIVLAVAAAALAGCGVLPGIPQSGGGEERQSRPVAESTTASAPEQQPEPASAPPQQSAVIASKETKVGVGDMYGEARVDLTGLKRQGRTATLTWVVTALDGKVNVHNGLGTGTLDFTVSGVALIDPVNAKRYRVARNGTGADAECVCSGTQGQFLKKGEASTLYAVFAAPPADVSTINVEMPGIGVFTDVPIA
ncbi:lipoprotein [Nonomuraea wenchangensis]